VRAAYLVRFDDLCPTMGWSSWEPVEEALVAAGVRPLLGIVPDNRDPKLHLEPARPDFWDRVRAWRDRGWSIGLHGCHHVLTAGERGAYGWDERTEFAGLPPERQHELVARAVGVFEREGVRPDVWIAPNHSFDETTLAALRSHGVGVVSDGHGVFPHRDAGGTVWVPMQLWRFRERPLGVWTVCFHHNRWGEREVAAFVRDLDAYSDRITDLPTVLDRYGHRTRGWIDRGFEGQRRARKRLPRARSSARRPRPVASAVAASAKEPR
jgi:predicted deacetylase